MAVEHEVVGHRDQPGRHGRGVVVDRERVHAQRVHGDVDHEAERADEPEAHELEPVRRAPHAVQKSHVRANLHCGRNPAGVNVHGGGVVAHSIQVIEIQPPARVWGPPVPMRASRGNDGWMLPRPLALQQ